MKIEFEPGQISSSQLRVPIESLLRRQVRQYSVVSALSKEFIGNRQAAIKKLSKQLGMDVRAFNQTDHNLMDKLIENGLLNVAREFAQHPDEFRLSHPDIVDLTQQMVLMINENRFGPTDLEVKLVEKLNQLIQNTFS